MLFRALFFVAIAALLMPREPDLGFGRPGAQLMSPSGWMSGMKDAIGHIDTSCREHHATCATTLNTLDALENISGRSLADVQAEIEADIRARKSRSG